MNYYENGGAVDLTGANTRAEESSLSSWAGPYVTEMLGRGQALASMPYQAYMGPLTAGQSGLQTQAFQGLANLTMPTAAQTTYNPMSFTGAGYAAPTGGLGLSGNGMMSQDQVDAFNANLGASDSPLAQMAAAQQQGVETTPQSVVQKYMSPYLQGALQPQYDAARRQADISAQNLQSQFGKAGAYGGSRQGVAEAELQRGLLDRMAGITGTGYQTAFEQAQNQFNEEQRRQMDAAGQAQRYGLDVLREQQTGGAAQRGIEGQGIAADIAQFEQERDFPQRQALFMQSLLQGQPLETQSYSYYEPSGLQSLAGGTAAVKSTLDTLKEIFG